MTSSGFNVTSSLTLVGFSSLSGHSSLLFFVFLLLYLFVLFSDSLVIYIICSQRALHRPMFAFVASLLLNSLTASTLIYPKHLSDLLLSGAGLVQVSRTLCLCQGFFVSSLGGASFFLLSAMAFDRYLSICHPMHYAVLVTPAKVVLMLLLCWMLPAILVGVSTLLVSRLPICRVQLDRAYCNINSLVSLSCAGAAAQLSGLFILLFTAVIVFLPAAFILFSYARILFICLRRSRSFSSKALQTCLPHLLVFFNYSISVCLDLMLRRLQSNRESDTTLITSMLMLVPTVLNPVVYGLKLKEVFTHVKRLLSCRRDS
ncbi:olfactory receptor 6N2-like [Pseudochaenichthys georgianus]|uniref:olfactory receptor 6N2-like n=1 Tax=Pseudochaenichthys georgianus TaxID=52239 RepID=UPI00146DC9AA|nr:olfactory receptor 6N2-like [Pseudochaenichthys georgianus]